MFLIMDNHVTHTGLSTIKLISTSLYYCFGKLQCLAVTVCGPFRTRLRAAQQNSVYTYDKWITIYDVPNVQEIRTRNNLRRQILLESFRAQVSSRRGKIYTEDAFFAQCHRIIIGRRSWRSHILAKRSLALTVATLLHKNKRQSL